MTININALPIEFSLSISGVMDNINIEADTLAFSKRITGLLTSYPPADRDPTLDWTFDCLGLESFETRDQGVLVFNPATSGDWLNQTIWDDTTLAFINEISGTAVFGNVMESGVLAFYNTISGDIIIEMTKTSWVKWSKIGYIDFTLDHSNQAGERPMEWTGLIYDILKHDNHFIIYGANGISVMKPKGNSFIYKTISRIGTKGRNAQISNAINDHHWFIDVLGKLWDFGTEIRLLDYREFLLGLSNPVMTINEKDNLIYICDGTSGYTYSYKDKCLASGPVNVSGYGYKDGVSLVTAPDDIVIPEISFVTDIYDTGTRKEKTLFNIEVNTDVSQEMEVCVYFRIDHTAPFVQTPWAKFTPRGIAYLPCYGIEFKIGFRMSVSAALNIDQFKINGVIHGFSFLDTIRKEN